MPAFSGLMLPAKNRLRREEIGLIMARGRSFQSDFLNWRCLPLPTTTSSRFAIVVPARLVKKAVWRNKIKRKIRAKLISIMPRLKPGWGTVILVRKALTLEQIKTLNDISLPPHLLSSAL